MNGVPGGGRRVVVTGIGVVSAAGVGAAPFWERLVAPTDAPVDGLVGPFDPTPWIDHRDARRSDPYVHYAVAAAVLAHEDAGSPDLDADRCGVLLGNAFGAPGLLERQLRVLADDGPQAVSPFLVGTLSEHACSAGVALRLGARGPVQTVAGACASGTYAIGDAANLIARGRCDAVLAGATQGPPTDAIVASFANLRVLAPDGWVRPFDTRRAGFAVADGAAVLVLEELAAARRRGAPIHAEVLGAANTNDAAHPVTPSGDGAVACLLAALDDAGLDPAAIVHVNAHGTGTKANDAMEAAAVRKVFGPVGRPGPSVTSIKRVTGHALAAAGAFEAAAVALSFRHRMLPPSGIDVDLDPDVDVDVVVGGPRPWDPGPTISCSYGLGGHNGAVVLAPPPPVGR